MKAKIEWEKLRMETVGRLYVLYNLATDEDRKQGWPDDIAIVLTALKNGARNELWKVVFKSVKEGLKRGRKTARKRKHERKN